MLLDGLNLATILANLFTLVIAFTVHEFAHAYTADLLGDTTPRLQGRLTLNPLVHLDPMGTLLLLIAGFGWARPVMVNPYALRRKTDLGPLIVALAGPFSNLGLAIVAAIPFQFGLLSPDLPSGWYPNLNQLFTQFVIINLVLMLFNLIPIAPLDGDKVVEYVIPRSWIPRWEQFRRYGPMVLLVGIFLLPYIGIDLLGWIIGPPLNLLVGLLIL